MIRARDVALRTALAAAPVTASCAAFEALMLTRVAAGPREVRRPGSRPPSGPGRGEIAVPGLLAEFDTATAAERLAATIAYIAPAIASVESANSGFRHKFEIHRVTVPVAAEPMVRNAIWRAGKAAAATICSPAALIPPSTPRLADRRRSLAAAAWRAALLAAGPGRGVDRLGVRIADADTTRVLVRSAAALGVPVHAVNRPGGQLISIVGQSRIDQLMSEVSAGWTTGRRQIPALAG